MNSGGLGGPIGAVRSGRINFNTGTYTRVETLTTPLGPQTKTTRDAEGFAWKGIALSLRGAVAVAEAQWLNSVRDPLTSLVVARRRSHAISP